MWCGPKTNIAPEVTEDKPTFRSLHWDWSQSLINPWGSLAKLNMNSLWVFSWLIVSIVSWIWEQQKKGLVTNWLTIYIFDENNQRAYHWLSEDNSFFRNYFPLEISWAKTVLPPGTFLKYIYILRFPNFNSIVVNTVYTQNTVISLVCDNPFSFIHLKLYVFSS